MLTGLLLLEKIHNSFEVGHTVLSLHVHEHAVRGRLHGDVEKRVDSGVVEDFRHFLREMVGKVFIILMNLRQHFPSDLHIYVLASKYARTG